MSERDDILERAIELLREPVAIDPDLDARIMAEIGSLPAPRAWSGRVWRAVDWLRRGRPVKVSPLGGLALAAACLVLFWVGRPLVQPADMGSAPQVAAVGGASVAQFVIVAPTAATVALVGDFNDWSASATPMQRVEGNGLWSVTIPLEPGRYRYAFLVDGSTWLRDPSAPPALDDDFGPPGSVVTIGEL